MQIIRTFVPNSLQNYNHLAVCPATKSAAAVDPFDAQHLLDVAKRNQLNIAQIWITHEHGDHIRDLNKLKALTGATVYAPRTCQGMFSADVWLDNDEPVHLGQQTVKHWLTPGHTPGHAVYVYQSEDNPEADFIICGDTLFNAGVGNTYAGDTSQLYKTVSNIIPRLSKTTQLFPGHDYLETNLKFVLNHFPECQSAHQTLDKISRQTPDTRSIMTLAEELQYNPFLALQAQWLKKHTAFKELDDQKTFVALRQLRDQW